MFAQKLLAIALIAVIAAGVSSDPINDEQVDTYDANKSHNFSVGYRVSGDKLVVRENVIVSGLWFFVKKVTKTYSTTAPWEKITFIQAVDQKTNGKGAFVTLLNGGPGQNNVTLQLKSQRGHGIDFVVDIYAL